MKRQFIAGASCPACGQLDKIQRVIDGDKQWMECVACGAVKNLDDKPQAHNALPESADAGHVQTVALQPAKKKIKQ